MSTMPAALSSQDVSIPSITSDSILWHLRRGNVHCALTLCARVKVRVKLFYELVASRDTVLLNKPRVARGEGIELHSAIGGGTGRWK